MFAGGPERRAYLFADYHYGLVDGNYKYIYDVTSAYSEIYDLRRDPFELHNLSGDPAVSEQAKDAYMRIGGMVCVPEQIPGQVRHESQLKRFVAEIDRNA